MFNCATSRRIQLLSGSEAADLRLIRPPEGRASVLPQMFSSSFFRHAFSEVPRPIALKLCHVVGIWPNFIITLQNFGGPPPPKKNWGPKTCKISVNFGPLQTLIANISGTAEDIEIRRRYKLWQFLLRLTKKVQ